MPEKTEIQDADPLLDVVSDLNLRVATVASGFSIPKDRGDESDDADQFVGECSHHWRVMDSKESDFEGCGV
jgi:hypothetical protein